MIKKEKKLMQKDISVPFTVYNENTNCHLIRISNKILSKLHYGIDDYPYLSIV